MTRFCNYCGTKLESEGDDCPTCGGGRTDERLKSYLDGTLSLPGVDLFAGEGMEGILGVSPFGEPIGTETEQTPRDPEEKPDDELTE